MSFCGGYTVPATPNRQARLMPRSKPKKSQTSFMAVSEKSPPANAKEKNLPPARTEKILRHSREYLTPAEVNDCWSTILPVVGGSCGGKSTKRRDHCSVTQNATRYAPTLLLQYKAALMLYQAIPPRYASSALSNQRWFSAGNLSAPPL
jgi:hypothetical protein